MRTKTVKNNQKLDKLSLEYLKKNNSREEVYKILKEKGFNESNLRKILHVPAEPIPVYRHFSENLNKCTKLGDHRFQLYTIENFLTPEECNEIIDKSKDKFSPSPILLSEVNPDKYFRTSKTYNIMKADFLESIETKISSFINLDSEYSEPLQIQYYEVGNEFKAHQDFFIKGTRDWEHFAGKKFGQRTWTFTVYLNDVENGGTTDFINLDIKVKPKTGKAVIWNNLYPNGEGNPDSMHAGTPVKAGKKYIITKWYRDIIQKKFYYK